MYGKDKGKDTTIINKQGAFVQQLKSCLALKNWLDFTMDLMFS